MKKLISLLTSFAVTVSAFAGVVTLPASALEAGGAKSYDNFAVTIEPIRKTPIFSSKENVQRSSTDEKGNVTNYTITNGVLNTAAVGADDYFPIGASEITVSEAEAAAGVKIQTGVYFYNSPGLEVATIKIYPSNSSIELNMVDGDFTVGSKTTPEDDTKLLGNAFNAYSNRGQVESYQRENGYGIANNPAIYNNNADYVSQHKLLGGTFMPSSKRAALDPAKEFAGTGVLTGPAQTAAGLVGNLAACKDLYYMAFEIIIPAGYTGGDFTLEYDKRASVLRAEIGNYFTDTATFTPLSVKVGGAGNTETTPTTTTADSTTTPSNTTTPTQTPPTGTTTTKFTPDGLTIKAENVNYTPTADDILWGNAEIAVPVAIYENPGVTAGSVDIDTSALTGAVVKDWIFGDETPYAHLGLSRGVAWAGVPLVINPDNKGKILFGLDEEVPAVKAGTTVLYAIIDVTLTEAAKTGGTQTVPVNFRYGGAPSGKNQYLMGTDGYTTQEYPDAKFVGGVITIGKGTEQPPEQNDKEVEIKFPVQQRYVPDAMDIQLGEARIAVPVRIEKNPGITAGVLSADSAAMTGAVVKDWIFGDETPYAGLGLNRGMAWAGVPLVIDANNTGKILFGIDEDIPVADGTLLYMIVDVTLNDAVKNGTGTQTVPLKFRFDGKPSGKEQFVEATDGYVTTSYPNAKFVSGSLVIGALTEQPSVKVKDTTYNVTADDLVFGDVDIPVAVLIQDNPGVTAGSIDVNTELMPNATVKDWIFGDETPYASYALSRGIAWAGVPLVVNPDNKGKILFGLDDEAPLVANGTLLYMVANVTLTGPDANGEQKVPIEFRYAGAANGKNQFLEGTDGYDTTPYPNAKFLGGVLTLKYPTGTTTTTPTTTSETTTSSTTTSETTTASTTTSETTTASTTTSETTTASTTTASTTTPSGSTGATSTTPVFVPRHGSPVVSAAVVDYVPTPDDVAWGNAVVPVPIYIKGNPGITAGSIDVNTGTMTNGTVKDWIFGDETPYASYGLNRGIAWAGVPLVVNPDNKGKILFGLDETPIVEEGIILYLLVDVTLTGGDQVVPINFRYDGRPSGMNQFLEYTDGFTTQKYENAFFLSGEIRIKGDIGTGSSSSTTPTATTTPTSTTTGDTSTTTVPTSTTPTTTSTTGTTLPPYPESAYHWGDLNLTGDTTAGDIVILLRYFGGSLSEWALGPYESGPDAGKIGSAQNNANINPTDGKEQDALLNVLDLVDLVRLAVLNTLTQEKVNTAHGYPNK